MRYVTKLKSTGNLLLVFLGHFLRRLTQTAKHSFSHFLRCPTLLEAHLNHIFIPNGTNLLIKKDR